MLYNVTVCQCTLVTKCSYVCVCSFHLLHVLIWHTSSCIRCCCGPVLIAKIQNTWSRQIFTRTLSAKMNSISLESAPQPESINHLRNGCMWIRSRKPGLLRKSQQPWDAVRPKGRSQFPLSPMELQHQPGPDLCECQSGQPTAWQAFFRKVAAVTTLNLSHNATKAQSSSMQRCGQALELSQVWLEALLPSHRCICCEIATYGHNIHWTRHMRNYARVSYLQLNNAFQVAVARTTCYVATEGARPFVAPSSEPQCGLTLIESLRPHFLNSIRSRIDGMKLSIPLTSRTPVAKCGAPSINLLAGLDAPFACNRSRQTSSPHN